MSQPSAETAESAPASSPPAASDDLYCPACGYNLHAIEGIARCPECGLAIDRAGLARSRIPWVHRRHVGRIRAYWRTLWLATLHPATLAAEASRRVDYRDAQRFRFVTAAVAAAPIVAALVGAMLWYGSAAIFSAATPALLSGWAGTGPASTWWDARIPWEAGATWSPVIPLAAILAVVLVTGVASYGFHPGSIPVVRQNRAIALSYYGCAPMALVSIPIVLAVAVKVMREAGLDNQANATWTIVRLLNIGVAISGALLFVAAWRSTMTLLRRTTHAGPGRTIVAGAMIPLAWLGCAVLVLAVLPWVVGFFRLVISSLL